LEQDTWLASPGPSVPNRALAAGNSAIPEGGPRKTTGVRRRPARPREASGDIWKPLRQ